ncbi:MULTISPECIES: hypothetical protein [Pseudomonadaceae]|uniref:Uncharacterized protein n=1 Tax=Stutzerimonas stutzeri TaxID=316 RepID=A0A172WNT0_STUST|nr:MULTISPECIES: hypothetical protein [Pseudomonadaceae]ANF24965.1 hypothetical protein PS273GM_07260 [Stutzerimonas stutzeri]MCQ4260689.1 hypothetical protein [Stutzerimonas stutzeri]
MPLAGGKSDWPFAEGGVATVTDGFAAGRAGAVAGVDLDAFAERQVAGEQRGVELRCQLLGAVLAEQVGAADVEVEQRIAGEQREGRFALLAVT